MKIAAAALAVLFASLAAAPVKAGIYSDDLARCLVRSTSDSDKSVLVKWIFTAIAAHPQFSQYSSINAADRAKIIADAGGLMGRLMTETCRQEFVTALRYEREGAITVGFSTLGQVAMGDLMRTPEVVAVLSSADSTVERDRMTAVLEEAGIAPAKPSLAPPER